MFKPVRFTSEVEDLVQFVEETDEANISEGTLAKLRAGIEPKMLLTAACLAVSRSTELPFLHHGGPIHAVCGTYPVYHTSRLLSGELAYLPIIQHVALCNLHVNAEEMGPGILPEIESLAGGQGGPEDTKQAFFAAIKARHPAAAEKHMLWLLERLTIGEVLDVILGSATSRNYEDDHFFLYPTFTVRALDCIGWEWAPILMRLPVRYLCYPVPYGVPLGNTPDFQAVEELLNRHRLLDIDVPGRTTEQETNAIGELADRMGKAEHLADIPEMLASALASGLSLEGAAEAVSIGAGVIHLRTSSGNPLDVHLHTGINIRRYLLKKEGLSLRNKLLMLLTWPTGPEIRSLQDMMNWSPEGEPGVLGKLPARSEAALLDAITQSIEAQPETDWSLIKREMGRYSGTGRMKAADEVRGTIALAHQYAALRYDPQAFFIRLAEIASRDDSTEMHAFKHHQAAFEEYFTTREPFRWIHLVAAAKTAAVIHGKGQRVYTRAKELLKVQ